MPNSNFSIKLFNVTLSCGDVLVANLPDNVWLEVRLAVASRPGPLIIHCTYTDHAEIEPAGTSRIPDAFKKVPKNFGR
jgi:predicted short-subunit dehydrogenase-like oxidoreductase (DUF2520 family)